MIIAMIYPAACKYWRDNLIPGGNEIILNFFSRVTITFHLFFYSSDLDDGIRWTVQTTSTDQPNTTTTSTTTTMTSPTTTLRTTTKNIKFKPTRTTTATTTTATTTAEPSTAESTVEIKTTRSRFWPPVSYQSNKILTWMSVQVSITFTL